MKVAQVMAESALFALLLQPLLAQSHREPGPEKSAPSIQAQLDALRHNQEQLARELEDIKSLLQERLGRSDFPSRPDRPRVISIEVRGEPFRGDSRARVGLMEYSDFDCSFCATYAREIQPRIQSDYVNTGKIRYYFRDLPAAEHTNSLLKARLARCAGEQGKFWDAHDRLFADSSPLAEKDVPALAQALGLESGPFQECVQSGRYTENIQRSAAGAKRMGLHGTPAFLIGALSPDGDFLWATNVLVGAESYDKLQTALDQALAQSPPAAAAHPSE